MNLVEEFDLVTGPGALDRFEAVTNEDGYEEISPSTSYENSLISLEGRRIRQAARYARGAGAFRR